MLSHAALRACVSRASGPGPGPGRRAGGNRHRIIESNGGKVLKTETWGLRNIAYRIQKNRKAHYVALDFEAPAGVVAELERQTQINEDVIRYMTIRVDEHETGPSAMMRRSERDRDGRGDRGDRGDRGGRGRDDDRPRRPREDAVEA
jgi:small subunit ribosomal protein S6